MTFPYRFTSSIPTGSGGSVVVPILETGRASRPVILMHPKVGNTASVLQPRFAVAGSPVPSPQYEWYRGELWHWPAGGTLIDTAATHTYTNASHMKMVWVKVSYPHASGTIETYSYPLLVCPSGWTSAYIGKGFTADAGQVSDPSIAPTYSPSQLYEGGSVVDNGAGGKFLCIEPWAYAVPLTDATVWAPIPQTYYIDFSASGSTNVGTIANPFNDPVTIRKKLTSGVSGFSAAPARTLWCIKRGQPAFDFSVFIGSGANAPHYWATYGTGARPIWRMAPMTQTEITAVGQAYTCLTINRTEGVMTFDIDFDGQHLIHFDYTLSSGSIAVGDVMTIAGINCTVKYKYTSSLSPTQHIWAECLPESGTFSQSGSSSFTTNASAIGTLPNGYSPMTGITKFGEATHHIGSQRCGFAKFSNAGWGVSNVGNLDTGDNFLVDCLFDRCGTKVGNGSAAGSGASARFRQYFVSAVDCGYNETPPQVHAYYSDELAHWAVAFCSAVSTGAFGNSAFVYHGRLVNGLFAYNRGDSMQSGWGINDGYGSQELMSGPLHMHHNLLENTSIFNAAQALPWEITCVQDFRIHTNITRLSHSTSAIYERRASGGSDSFLSNGTFAHNVWDTSKVCLGKFLGTGGANVTGVKWINNIHAQYDADVALAISYDLLPAQLYSDFNMYFRQGGGNVITYYNGGTSPAQQSFASASALNDLVPAVEPNGITADPQFVARLSGNYNLGPTSLARNAGMDARYEMGMAVDWEGRPLPANPHLGTHQTA